MFYQMKTGTTKIVTALIIAGVLAFLAFIVPEHLSEPTPHDNCPFCQFIQHAPLLEPEAVADIVHTFQAEWLQFVSEETAS